MLGKNKKLEAVKRFLKIDPLKVKVHPFSQNQLPEKKRLSSVNISPSKAVSVVRKI